MDRAQLVEQVRKAKAIDNLLESDGWKVLHDELQSIRDKAIRSLVGPVDSHPQLAKWSGRLDVILDILSFPSKVKKEGDEASKRLTRRGGSSSTDEESDEE
jgi:hypothetical protein